MPQTFYIESDEEIISVIGRLRKSSVEENIFVFPKRALVLQSIINLRLFQREAEKLGKKIVIVSQDEVGRMLAEKAGIETENYSEDFSQKASHLELTSKETSSSESSEAPMASERENIPSASAIGTNDFYATEAAVPRMKIATEVIPPLSAGTPLRVRNATPEKLTSLNSKRFDQPAPSRMENFSPRISDVSAPVTAPQVFPSQQPTIESKRIPGQDRGERLKNFYSGEKASAPVFNQKKELKQSPVAVGKKARMIFFILGGISLLSLVTVVLFFLLPKAEVHVTPYKTVQTIDKEFVSKVNASDSSNDALPVRVFEREKEIALTVATTGKSGGTNQKARGTVIIYNNYSTDPQPLVATTRLETPDGKLFRLENGVTVPAMTMNGSKGEPGVIEAQVIADQSGTEYNVDATTFTIPGFKGSQKFEKFSAKSTKAMTGGGSSGASDVAVVAKVDLDTAIREAKEKVKEEFLNDVRGDMTAEEKVLDEQVDIVSPDPTALPSVGTVANAFDYKGIFKLRAIIFSEKGVKEKIESMSNTDVGGVHFKSVSSSLTYGDSSVDFSSGEVRIKAHALVTLESSIDKNKLQEMLLGKNESGIKQVLDSFPEVKNIQVIFHPQWFVESIPSSSSRVTMTIEPGEDKP